MEDSVIGGSFMAPEDKPWRIGLFACIALTACATPDIDTTTPTFTQAQYEADLEACRGGNEFEAVAKGAGGMLGGAFYGLLHGAAIGAGEGNGLKGAAVGTATGAVIGFVGGLYKPATEERERVEQCLLVKGYRIKAQAETAEGG